VKFTKRTIVGATAGAVLAAGAAYAFIALTAQGTATAAAAQVQNPTIANITVVPMLPGTSSKVSFEISNPNSFKVKVLSIKRTGAYVAAPGACQTAEINGPLSALDAAVALPAPVTLDAGQTNVAIEVPSAIGLTEASTQTCAVSFPIQVDALQQGN